MGLAVWHMAGAQLIIIIINIIIITNMLFGTL